MTDIKIGWRPHEIEWLKAAMTLDKGEHLEAFKDIASLSHRSVNAVRTKAYEVRREQQAGARKFLGDLRRSGYTSPLPVQMAKSLIRPNTKEDMMTGRAR